MATPHRNNFMMTRGMSLTVVMIAMILLTPRVLYFSLHRYDNGKFYPNSVKADSTHVGGASAKGYNVNMAWSGSRMADAEYLAAFHHLLLPIAYEV